jgi:hypothetical protein
MFMHGGATGNLLENNPAQTAKKRIPVQAGAEVLK